MQETNRTLLGSLSKRWRNAGPDKTKIIVTNLPDVTAEVISIYQRRWSVEVIFKELKSGLGLGEHQVTKTGIESETQSAYQL